MSVEHLSPSGLGEALRAGLLRLLIRAFMKPVFSPRVSIAFQRRWIERLSRRAKMPAGVTVEPGTVAGMAGLWSRLEHASSTATLLYLHGGAYCMGSPATHRSLTARLARASGMAVFSLDYPLAPEHPFPAGIDSAVAAFLALAAQGAVAIGGDSAGGGLSLATALALREGAHATPAALLLLSPWVDLRIDPAVVTPPGEIMLSVPWGAACAAHYLRDTPPAHPWASPLLANLHGLPRCLIQLGSDELLHDQALQMHDALQAADVDVHCEVMAQRWHVYPLHGGLLRTSDEAIARAGRFLAAAVAAP